MNFRYFTIRIDEETLAVISNAAKKMRLPVSVFIRSSAYKRALEVLKEYQEYSDVEVENNVKG